MNFDDTEPLSIASAEIRVAEILAQIASISRQIEADRQSPHEGPLGLSWRRSSMKARDELRSEARDLQEFIANEYSRLARGPRSKRRADDLARQDADRATKSARKIAKQEHRTPVWDAYLKAEVALLSIVKAGGDVGPLGDSLLRTATDAVPAWYRDHWLRTVYGTTWGREAARARSLVGARSLSTGDVRTKRDR